MSNSLQDSTFSLSSRYFNWKNNPQQSQIDKPDNIKKKKNKKPSKLRTALSLIGRFRPSPHRVVGTLFGYRRGHVYFAIQEDPKQSPMFLIELSTRTSVLVREMGCGLVRMALECDNKLERKRNCKLVEEGLWRTYCNGNKCGYASRTEFGAQEQRILKAVEPITMGAGVLPAAGSSDGELMYMRGRFDRVVGSKDSEAFYMISPDSNAGPELSVYLLRL